MEEETQVHEEDTEQEETFRLFPKPSKAPKKTITKALPNPSPSADSDLNLVVEKSTAEESEHQNQTASFKDLGLADWAVRTCSELGIRRPTAVQARCIPQILAGRDVLGLAQTGSGKTAAFALPILQLLAGNPYGVFAVVVTPTRELAYQMAEQFRALGSAVRVRCSVVVGGMDLLTQAKALMERPHVVIATPGRIRVLIEEDPGIAKIFSKTKVISVLFFLLVCQEMCLWGDKTFEDLRAFVLLFCVIEWCLRRGSVKKIK